MTGFAAPKIDVRIGDVSGSHVVIGDCNTIQLLEGMKVTVLQVGERPVPRLRPMPLAEFPPMRFGLLGRRAEMSLVAWSSPKSPLQVYGPEGIGKTVLLKAVAHHPSDAREGVVFLSARRRTIDEVLAGLYKACWASDVPFVPMPSEIGAFLVDREALVVLDDCSLDRGDLEVLLDTAPRCRFVIGCEQRTVWAIGHAEQLAGLDPEASFQLLERELDGVLDGGDRTAASTVITVLGGHPQRLVEVAALVKSGKASWHELAGGSVGLAARIDAQALTSDERRILVLLGLLGGAALGSAHIGTVANVDRVDERLGELERRGWVKSASPRFRQIRPLQADFSDPSHEALTADLLDHLASFASEEQESAAVAEEAEAIEAALAVAAEAGAWRAALSLVCASERKLAQSGEWVSWRRVLSVGLRAARALGDVAAEAHMLHQLGSLALCLGLRDEALAGLREALRIREHERDEAGAEVTRHNLRQLDPGGPAADDGGERPSGPRWPRRAWLFAAFTVIAAAIVALLAVGQNGSRHALDGRPAIQLSQPRNGASYLARDVVYASYRCTAGRNAALASCRGTVPNGSRIDTATGTHAFEVIAADRNGTRATMRVTYRVSPRPAGTVTITLTSPKDGAAYVEGTTVTADYSCAPAPAGSRVASCSGPVPSGEPIDTTTIGQHTFIVSATDKTGKPFSRTARYTVTAQQPMILIDAPEDGRAYIQGTTVRADYTCRPGPGGSGLTGCSGPVPSGQPIDTSTIGQHTFTVSTTDKAGNVFSKTARYTVSASAPPKPTILIASPTDGASYAQDTRVVADYSCAPAPSGPGLASCSGPVPSGQPIDTSSIGQHTFTVSATDKAGGVASTTYSYMVTPNLT